MKIQFAKVRETATIPTKDKENLGYDVYADFKEQYIFINPNQVKMIPTGIASIVDKDYGIIIKERGSTGSKGLAVRCGVIDSNYRGEWFIALNNTSEKPIIIAKEEYAEDIKQMLKDNGLNYFILFPCDLTKENFENVTMLIDPKKPLGLITSDYHMDRALRMAGQAGFEKVLPYPSRCPWFSYGANVLSEVILAINEATFKR